MGIFDEIKDKVSEFVEGNPDKATDGKFSDQVDQGQQIADDKIGE